MPIDLSIPEDKTKYLSDPAKNEFIKATYEYCDNVLQEAARLEMAIHITDNEPEINATMIHDAVILIRHGIGQVKKKKWYIIVIPIVATLFSFFAGLLADLDAMQDIIFYLVGFLIVAVIACVATIFAAFLKE